MAGEVKVIPAFKDRCGYPCYYAEVPIRERVYRDDGGLFSCVCHLSPPDVVKSGVAHRTVGCNHGCGSWRPGPGPWVDPAADLTPR